MEELSPSLSLSSYTVASSVYMFKTGARCVSGKLWNVGVDLQSSSDHWTFFKECLINAVCKPYEL